MDADINAVRVAGTPQGPVPVVILSVEEHRDVLPIFIGFDEARSIAHGIDALDVGRPMTHDLFLDTIEELGGRVIGIEICDLTEDGTFIANLHIKTPRGKKTIDARPSDSLALAARTNAEITIDKTVFEENRRDPGTFNNLQDIREIDDLDT